VALSWHRESGSEAGHEDTEERVEHLDRAHRLWAPTRVAASQPQVGLTHSAHRQPHPSQLAQRVVQQAQQFSRLGLGTLRSHKRTVYSTLITGLRQVEYG